MKESLDEVIAGCVHHIGFDAIVQEALAEAERASARFPQPNYIICKIAEESGEVVKAAIHAAEGRESPKAVRTEMVQTIAMLYRLWAEGDGVLGLAPISGHPPKADNPKEAAEK